MDYLTCFVGLHLAGSSSIENSDAQIAIKAREINRFLRDLGVTELKRSYRSELLDLRQIEFMANKVTALVNCWAQY